MEGFEPMDLDKAISIATEIMEEWGKKRSSLEEANMARVLEAFSRHRVGLHHLGSATGYGYNDVGRDTLELIWADVFGAEAAMVRQQIATGTQAIYLALAGNLRPGDELLTIGKPYDTLENVIGCKEPVPCSLVESGVHYRQIDINYDIPDVAAIVKEIGSSTKIVSLQRSKGYEWRPSLTIDKMATIIAEIKKAAPHVIVFVDNCYGEFVEACEPTALGADLIAGSLIKNPGGGIAPGGGYIAGKMEFVERAAMRLNAPGAGREVGPSLLDNRLYYQGLFLANSIVGEALRSAVFAGALFEQLGYPVSPSPFEERTDIIQAIQLGSAERLKAFCRCIQKYAPIDSYVTPEPWDMPGYNRQVIMAAGAFVQGSSIELSADAPMVEPYNVYLQGGLSRYHGKIAVTATVRELASLGLL